MEKRIKKYWLEVKKKLDPQFKKLPLNYRKPFLILIEKVFISGFYAGEDNAKQEKP